MARRTTIRVDLIIQAAREVFLEQGIRATTADVARRAGVSEGSLFNHFKNKSALFEAAMRSSEEPWWSKVLSERAGRGDLRQNLAEIGMLAIDHLRRLLPLMMMTFSNPSSSSASHPLLQPNPPPIRVLKSLEKFFEAEMRARRMRRHDPEIVARVFMGSIQNYVFFELLLKAHDELPIPAELYLSGMLGLLFAGIAPTGSAAPARGSRARSKTARRPGKSKRNHS